MDATPPPSPLGQPYASLTPPETSGLAITSLILGILGLFTCGLTGIPAVICGHIALSNINKSFGRQGGSGLAVGGLITGYFSFVLAFVGVLLGMALPVFGEVRDRANLTYALSQIKQVGSACRVYAGDHDGKFPPKLEDLVPDYLPDANLLACPYPDRQHPVTYQYYGGSEKDAPGKILIASPAVPNKGRIFYHVDGFAETKTRIQLKQQGTP